MLISSPHFKPARKCPKEYNSVFIIIIIISSSFYIMYIAFWRRGKNPSYIILPVYPVPSFSMNNMGHLTLISHLPG